MTRRRWLYSALGIGVGYSTLVEPRWLAVTRREARLPGMHGRVRLAQLSDLHASIFVPLSMIEHAIDCVLAEKPDVICVTGDFITRGSHVDMATYGRALRRLSAASPTLAVLGNHDGGRWANVDSRPIEKMLEDAGIDLLQDRSVSLKVRESKLTVAGMRDLWSGDMDEDRAFQGIDGQSGPVLVMAHNPDSKDVLIRQPWHMMLSGHTHGGQVRIPFDGGWFAPVVDKRYVEGLLPWESRLIHVTRGVGDLWGVRFRCRPEVNVLDLS